MGARALQYAISSAQRAASLPEGWGSFRKMLDLFTHRADVKMPLKSAVVREVSVIGVGEGVISVHGSVWVR